MALRLWEFIESTATLTILSNHTVGEGIPAYLSLKMSCQATVGQCMVTLLLRCLGQRAVAYSQATEMRSAIPPDGRYQVGSLLKH